MIVYRDWIIYFLGLLAFIGYLVYALFEESKEREPRARGLKCPHEKNVEDIKKYLQNPDRSSDSSLKITLGVLKILESSEFKENGESHSVEETTNDA